MMSPWPAFYEGAVTSLTAEQFAAKQRSLGIEDIPWTEEELALPGAENFAPEALVPSKGPIQSALRPLPEEDTTWGPTPTGKEFNMGGFLPGGGGGLWGGLGGILGDIFGDDPYSPGGWGAPPFLPGPPAVPPLWPPMTDQPGPIYPGQGRDVIVSQGQVMMDNCGRCYVVKQYPARMVRRKARIIGCNAAGPVCVPLKPRMNALNPRALSRALRRAKAFAKFARKAVKIQQDFKGGRVSGFGRKRKAARCCPK